MDKKELESFKSVKGFPHDISANAREYLIGLINLTAGDNDLVSVQRAKQNIKNGRLIKKIIHTLRGFHTHNIKIPNTSRIGQIYFAPTSEATVKPGIYSQTIKPYKYFAWAANAAESKAKLFLATEFIYQGELTCLFLEFLKPRSDLIVALLNLGLSNAHAETICSACQSVVKHPMPEQAEDPQLLWPMDDDHDDYLAITPVAHVATLREIGQRTKLTDEAAYYFNTEKILVGGTQPINAGDYVSSVAGWLTLLKSALPPKDYSYFTALCRRVGIRKTALDLKVLKDKDFDFMALYEVIDSVVYENKQQLWISLAHNVKAFELLEAFIDRLFGNLLELRDFYHRQQLPLPEWVIQALPKLELSYIQCTTFTQRDIEAFIEHTLQKLAPMIRKQTKQDPRRRFNNHLRDLLNQQLANYLGYCDE